MVHSEHSAAGHRNYMEHLKKHLIYCPIFKDELHAVLGHPPGIIFHELGYDVHIHSKVMQQQLNKAVQESKQCGGALCILLGKECECDVPISKIASENNGRLPDYINCIEIFLGKEKTLSLQKNRTALMTPAWMQMIQNAIATDLWTVEDARMNLGWYDRILLLDTQVTRISDEEIMEFYDLVQVPVEMMDIDLDHFRVVVKELLR